MLGKKNKKQHLSFEGEGGRFCDGHCFLRQLVPGSRGGFPKGAASPWLLELHILSQGARNGNTMESHLFMCKIASNPALSMSMYHNILCLLLWHVMCWDE